MGISHPDVSRRPLQQLVNMIPIPLLALLWFTQFDDTMFLDLRDSLLLSNPLGRKFSDFYYAYTLYPAESFKSLNQKNIKTCALENIQIPSINLNLENRLMAGGYLMLPDSADVNLKIVQKEDDLIFRSRRRLIFRISLDRFFSESQQVLQRFSQQTDRHLVLRQFTFWSLLLGFPILIYLVVHGILYYLLLIFFKRKAAALTASIVCLLIGILVLVHFQSNRGINIEIKDISQALESSDWRIRVAALKTIQQQKLKITDYKAYPRLLKSRIPQERYWLVKALGYSHGPGTYDDLLAFLDDKHTNVRCMALYALGLRKNPNAIQPILDRLTRSDDWYSQTYAYNALKALGWKQIKLP
jgi:hypothetical protein